jgi:fructose-1-phosphate kinase PfkB-like protein
MQRVTIFEFAPTADEIWRISQHNRDGYASYNAENGLVSILDTAHDAKQRPEIITTYAGGKATNVARVLDRLLVDESDVYVELVTFLPPPPAGPLQDLDFGDTPLRPSTPAGIYVQCLQMLGLRRVRPLFQVVDELEETGGMQTTRRCIEITLGESGASLNFSPRIVWSQRAAEAVLSRASKVARDADLVVMAGAPPVWDVREDTHLTSRNFYSRIMDAFEPGCQVSIDTRGQYLYDCLVGQKKPRFILMNTDEFSELLGLLTDLDERTFSGTLIVHDEHGTWVWDNELPDGHDPFPEAAHFPSVPVRRIYSTIGAGDAMHAGFLKEWICAGSGARGNASQDERFHRAVVYSQVVAAVSVSNNKATHGIDAHTVESWFRQIWQGGRSSC